MKAISTTDTKRSLTSHCGLFSWPSLRNRNALSLFIITRDRKNVQFWSFRLASCVFDHLDHKEDGPQHPHEGTSAFGKDSFKLEGGDNPSGNDREWKRGGKIFTESAIGARVDLGHIHAEDTLSNLFGIIET